MPLVQSFTDPSITYKVNIEKRYCTCPSWKYQKRPLYARIPCKHLKQFIDFDDHHIEFNKVKLDGWQLIAEPTSDDVVINKSDWLMSLKYDGLRAMLLPNKTIVTRGGYNVPERFIENYDILPRDRVLDGELVTVARNSTHNKVQAAMSSVSLNSLMFIVFDDLTSGRDRPFIERLMDMYANNNHNYLIRYYMLNNSMTVEEIRNHVKRYNKNIEGVVVRNIYSKWVPESRSVNVAIKIK